MYSLGNYHGHSEAYFELVFAVRRLKSVEKIGKYVESEFFINLIQNYSYSAPGHG